jgi:hypothetical protein
MSYHIRLEFEFGHEEELTYEGDSPRRFVAFVRCLMLVPGALHVSLTPHCGHTRRWSREDVESDLLERIYVHPYLLAQVEGSGGCAAAS